LPAYRPNFTARLAPLAVLLAFCSQPGAQVQVWARPVNTPQIDSPQALRAIAFSRCLENRPDTALDFYQKAIDKSCQEYGANSTYTGNLYFEMGNLALRMSKFSTAESCLTRAVQINPNSDIARLKLAELLRLREKSSQARGQIQQSVQHNVNSAVARLWMIAALQDNNPAAATKQSFYLHQILNGVPIKVPVQPKPIPTTSEQTKTESQSGQSAVKAASARTAIQAITKVKGKSDLETRANTKAGKKNPSAPQALVAKEPRKAVTAHRQAEPKVSKAQEAKASKRTSAKATIASHPHLSKGALVPPPPTDSPVFQGLVPRLDPSGPEIQLKTQAKVTKKPPAAKPDNELSTKPSASAADKAAKASASSASAQENDPDFLIEWASVKKKQGKGSK
jgi:tetratricopeptide (TPR) repeat protein